MLTRPRRVSRREPCPICGHADWCLIGDTAILCMRVPDGARRTVRFASGATAYVHPIRGAISPGPREPRAESIALASPAILHRAYTALLKCLPLSREHRAALVARGFSDEAIGRRNYATLPPGPRGGIARRVMAQAGLDSLAGVPGFYLAEGRYGPFWSLDGPPGLLVPVRDIDGRIIACQIRRDNVPEGGARYVWLSSAPGGSDRPRPGGTSPGAPVHVARPERTESDAVVITEGPLKGDRATLGLGLVTLAVPGVGNWRQVLPVLRELRARRVIVAYDMDLFTNRTVHRHAEDLVGALRSVRVNLPEQDVDAPLQVWWARWDGSRAKGIDDALQANVEIHYQQM